MNKEAFIRKLDDGIDSLRGLLKENEGSTLKAIASSAKQGFDNLKEAFAHSEKAQKAMSEIKKQCLDLEKAVQKGDKELSAKLLDAAEKKLAQYKKKFEGAPKEKTAPAKPGKAVTPKKAGPAGKTGADPATKKTAGASAKKTSVPPKKARAGKAAAAAKK